ncbi:hypothetical protein [Haladaptatus sp. CMAA 1911]|uniref:DUF7504 family protein n=1 Tax=unclassified Haladaptatus TaxID=2622732 RepID=UPI0037552CF9
MTSANLDFETGSSVLVTAPSDADRRAESHPLTHFPHDDTNALVAVTCDRSAKSLLDLWRQHVGQLPNAVRVIEVGTSMRKAGPSSDGSIPATVDTVHRPDDLAGIRAAITSALAAFDDETTLLFDSLTTPLEHVSVHRMVSFFDAVSKLLADMNAVGYFRYDGYTDEPAVAPFRMLADETVEFSDDADRPIRSTTTNSSDGPSLDSMFEALSSRRRRDALRYLLETDGTVGIDELARVVARRDIGERKLTPNHHRQYYATLY